MQNFLKRTWAEINLDHLLHNHAVIAKALHPTADMMAVVKADAYGHGAVYVAKTLQEAGVSYFAVSNLEEALQLRAADITQPILILSYTPATEVTTLAAHHLTQTVISLSHAKELNAAAEKAGISLPVHFKLDTGMSRVGFVHQTTTDRRKAAEEIAASCALPALSPEGIFTHFATADEQDDAMTNEQFARFEQTVSDLSDKGIRFTHKHCCNSAATERFSNMHLDLVRPGIILYGLAPDASWMQALLPLKPVMQLKTVISMVKTIPAGASVSYGATFTAKTDMQIATVPIGYADGYPRCMRGKAHMLVNGAVAPLVGRVCMDQCMLDVTGLNAKAGDIVTVFGDGLSVDTYAAWMDSINYEAVCLVGKRVPRVYLRDGKQIGHENLILKEYE